MRSYAKISGNKHSSSKRAGLTHIVVRARPGAPTQGLLKAGAMVFPCALGRGAIVSDKREGDGGTPLARMRLVGGYFVDGPRRPPATRLPMRPIGSDLGWCEVPDDRNYNRPVRIPYAASHETMLRPDGLYDVCIVLDWNLMPRRRGRGSAIFFHLARTGYTPTQGCVAVSAATMRRLLPLLSARTILQVTR
jgi:L,D-peptidoglycan transpeptidase YkuD (ErfK/YbiS/YcfS/YnhG family)